MTTSHSELIDIEALELLYVSAEDPDMIGIEVYYKGNMLFDVSLGRQGNLTIMFDDAENVEFELGAFRRLLDRCVAELEDWKTKISVPGDIWDSSNPQANV